MVQMAWGRPCPLTSFGGFCHCCYRHTKQGRKQALWTTREAKASLSSLHAIICCPGVLPLGSSVSSSLIAGCSPDLLVSHSCVHLSAHAFPKLDPSGDPPALLSVPTFKSFPFLQAKCAFILHPSFSFPPLSYGHLETPFIMHSLCS